MNSLHPAAVTRLGHRLPFLQPPSPPHSFRFRAFSPLCLRFPPPFPVLRSVYSVRASLPNSKDGAPKESERVPDFQVYDRIERSSFSLIPIPSSLKAIFATVVAVGAIFFARYCSPVKPAWAMPDSARQTAEQAEEDLVMDEKTEKLLEEQFRSDQCDIEGLRILMEIKIKNKKISEAIEILNKLTEVEPEEVEWPLLRSHLYAYNGDFEIARNGFSELLRNDPFRVEAYHGLVAVASQEESTEDLRIIGRKIEEAIKLCKKENKKSDARDFKLLLAQIKVIESRYDEALKAYEELVKEEPRDFRPYLCQGIIYTMLRKNKEAENNFEKYRRLVPKGHPYASYFDDNMIATKLFAQKMETDGAMAKRQ